MSDSRQSDLLFAGKSEMAQRMRSHDWSKTSLGPVETWPQSLKTALRIMLTSSQPMWVWWGKELLNFYNDPYRSILGGKHPAMFARPGAEVWQEIWDEVHPRIEYAMLNNEGTYDESLLFIMERNGYPEETYYTFSYSPIPDDQGNPGGIICANTDDTQRIIGERQLTLLRELAARTADARTFDEACTLSATGLAANLYDLPFAMIYLVDAERQCAVLAGVSGIDRTHPAVTELIDLTAASAESFAKVVQTQQVLLIDDLATRFSDLPTGAWDRVLHQAVIMPIAPSGATGRSGLLLAGLNPLRLFDDNYRNFMNLVAGQIAASIANANAYEEERKRAEALAELDRAKTLFFTNVSHEFRTPLTLMLSPLEELSLSLTGRLQPDEREQLDLMHRNGLRLQKLVNTLLDFSRIEAGRIQAVYEPIDLATYTAELASAFRSLIEQAEMSLMVECPPLPEEVYVDREMWEKIVLNLLSNAFKFTLSGSITVRLLWCKTHVDLVVEDTGVGIPSAALPHMFERFHRVENSEGRSFEGSGIGLSLVQELVKFHSGSIQVTSVLGEGSSFTVSIPTGTAHLPGDRLRSASDGSSASSTLTSTAIGVIPYVEEAQRWLPQVKHWQSGAEPRDAQLTPLLNSVFSTAVPTARILLADDNADMRDYIQRLLSSVYQVEAVADGMDALQAVQQNPPDLVLTDVMMPRMDGFELLRQLRNDEQNQEIPIILLSARAGEESRIEGLAAGADDYLIKPFSARELMARVEATLKLAQLRRTAREREQALQLETQRVRANLERILSSLREGFLTLDRDWCYTYINDRQLEIIGRSRESTLGRSIWEIFSDLVGTELYHQFHQAMHERVPVQIEIYYPPLQGWFDNRVYPTEDGIAIFVVDVSERKQAEAEREQLLQREQAAREQAEIANRVKDEFLAVLSHELRTPLNPILGWSSLLRQGKLDAAKTAQAAAIVERNAKLQVQLIDDLLDISRILRGKLILNILPVDLRFVINAVLETMQLSLDAKAIALHTHLEPNVGLVMGEAGRLQQVIWNLLSNAVKFTPPEGQITVTLTQRGTNAQIQVADTGKGIHPNFLPYVFEYFCQEDAATTRKFGGLGLGLAITRQIVEMHGGTVQADSPGEEQGATFTVQIPLAPQSLELPNTQEILESILDLSGTRILVVDDETDSREFVVFVLEQANAIVASASSGFEALQCFAQSTPDIIISDIGMPDMNGYMLMQHIRALDQGKTIPAIAFTAYAGELDQRQSLAAGFQKHIAKPIEPEVLIKAIASLILSSD
ncbi:MAG TPA: response regulator [Coleofasciculaceae cyanobacterium]|jgi:signal transduction histidine kinase